MVVSEETGLDAPTLSKKLTAHGVQTRPFFLGMHEQPIFKRREWFCRESYPVGERLARQGLYLPSGVALTDEQLEHVADVLQQILEK